VIEKLNWMGIWEKFPYLHEIPIIFSVIQDMMESESFFIEQFPLLVNPYAFMLAIRKQEGGKEGKEFGIMHEEAINKNLITQAEWAFATILKDTKRWHLNTLICVGDRKREDFADWIEYFGTKYCPVGAENDPMGLNKFWLPNVRRNYSDFMKDE